MGTSLAMQRSRRSGNSPCDPDAPLPWEWLYRRNTGSQRGWMRLAMAKRRNRPLTVNTKHFEGVTSQWVKPGAAPVPERYHVASNSLADWAASLPNCRPEDWSDNDKTGFFVIRHYCVIACERWRSHDWRGDVKSNQALRKAKGGAGHLLTATRKFRASLDSSNIPDAWDGLGLQIAVALDPDEPIDVRDASRTSALQEAFDAFEMRLEGFADRPYRFGPLRYQRPPRSIRPETALAIVLADIVTECRRDTAGHRRGRNPCRIPEISSNTPWKAIAEFIKANRDDPEEAYDPEGLKTSVDSHLPSVQEIQLFP